MPQLRISKLLLIPVISAMTVVAFAFPRLNAAGMKQVEDEARMKNILQSTGDYCERVKNIALKYVCQENIIDIENFFTGATETMGMHLERETFNIRRVKRQTYMYEYQLIRQEDNLSERRIMLKKNGKEKNKKNANLNHLKYYSQYLIYGPVGFLSRYWQQHFQYSLIGEGTTDGESVSIIQAVPNKVRLDNYNIGRIWINEDFQIVRLEWEPASIQNYENEVMVSRLGQFQKKVLWRVDYTYEKNGVRFPGRQLIQEIFFRESDDGSEQKAVKRETKIEYNMYKFFTVETEVTF